MTDRHVRCELHRPGASRPRAIATERLSDGHEIDVCAECLEQLLGARIRLGLAPHQPYPTPDALGSLLHRRATEIRTH